MRAERPPFAEIPAPAVRGGMIPADPKQPGRFGACAARWIRASTLFDARWYLARYPDVRAAGLEPLHHYLEHGAAEGRDPGPRFSTERYTLAHPEVAAAGHNPLLDYLARRRERAGLAGDEAPAAHEDAYAPLADASKDEAATGPAVHAPAPPVYQSCDPYDLYAEGGFPAEPLDLERLAREGAAGELVAELFPAFGYHRGVGADTTFASARFAAEILAMQASVNAGASRGAPCRLYRIPEAVLSGSVIATLRDGEPKIVYETHRPQDRATLPLSSADTLRAAPRCEGAGEVYLFLGSSGSFNYGHWLVDDLPRSAAVAHLRRLYPGQRIVVVLASQDVLIDPVRQQTIDFVLHGESDVRVMFAPQAAALRFENLFVATPITVHPNIKSPDALHWLRRRLSDQSRAEVDPIVAKTGRWVWPRSAPSRRRLFVMRNPARGRGLTNADAVFRALKRFGFELINVEAMNFASQVATFSNAGIIVGTMGGGMANTLVCPAGTAVIHLAPEGWAEPFFWDLAAVMEHRYHAVYGPSEGTTYTSPFHVDVATVVALVARYAKEGGA